MSGRLFAGIDIGATNIKFGLVDGDGAVVFRDQVPTPNDSSADEIFDRVSFAGERLLIEADDREGMVQYIGVGSPGSVNMTTGVVQGTCPNLPHWVGFPLRDRLAEKLNLSVMVDNDANCAALAEQRFGVGKGYRNIICLTIGTGIGGALIIDGRLYRGADFSAGEIGHLPVTPPGDAPGALVPLEKVVSAPAILNAVRERLADKITPIFRSLIGTNLDHLTIKKIFVALGKGDPIVPEVLRVKGRLLGIGLAGLVNVINPEIVILGGGVAEGGRAFVDIVKETIVELALPAATTSLVVAAARLGNAAGFIGAAFLGGDGDGQPQ